MSYVSCYMYSYTKCCDIIFEYEGKKSLTGQKRSYSKITRIRYNFYCNNTLVSFCALNAVVSGL